MKNIVASFLLLCLSACSHTPPTLEFSAERLTGLPKCFVKNNHLYYRSNEGIISAELKLSRSADYTVTKGQPLEPQLVFILKERQYDFIDHPLVQIQGRTRLHTFRATNVLNTPFEEKEVTQWSGAYTKWGSVKPRTKAVFTFGLPLRALQDIQEAGETSLTLSHKDADGHIIPLINTVIFAENTQIIQDFYKQCWQPAPYFTTTGN